jgi:hypothetical protein
VHNAAVHVAACGDDPGSVVAFAEWLLKQGRPYQQAPGLHTWPVHFVEALVALAGTRRPTPR